MKVGIIGTGYVGLVQGTCFAESGNNVLCMDIDEEKIRILKTNGLPIYEPGLEELVHKNVKEGRLDFTTSMEEVTIKSDVIFLCLPTPPSDDGSADVSRVLKVSDQVASLTNGYKILVSKSTVPVGTVDKIKEIVKRHTAAELEVVSSPEFLKEGSALQDSLKPDRVIIGSSSSKAIDILKELYEPFVRTGNPIIVMDERSAEMTKYAANAFLATKISFMNELALLCEAAGADIDVVRKGIASDPRIGKHFLFAGVGYGGSCFPKDVKALIQTGNQHETPLYVLQAVDEVNERQKSVLIKKLMKHFGLNIRSKKIAVWGLAFKPQTDDIREAPSLVIISNLLREGATVSVHDPVATENVRKVYGGQLTYHENAYEALRGADALVIVTEWNEFRTPDFDRMKSELKGHVIFDGRNIYDPRSMRERGFQYYGIGRKHS